MRIHFPEARWLFLIIERVRRMFDLTADPNEIASCFLRDPILASRVRQSPGLRVPGCWDGFELAVRAVLGQQVSVRGATTLAGRLVRSFGTPVNAAFGLTHLFPSSQKMAESDLASIGLPKTRATALRAIAQAVCDGKISFAGVVNVEEFLAQFCELPGIGNWTAQYVAMRALNEPDGFPASDLGLLRALNLRDPRKLSEMAQGWRPWRAYAAMYLWQTSAEPTFRKIAAASARFNQTFFGIRLSCSVVKDKSMTTTSYCEMDSPIGSLLLVADDSGLLQVNFCKGRYPATPDASWVENPKPLKEPIGQLKAYFAGTLQEFDLPLSPRGTKFQVGVWKSLCDNPIRGDNLLWGTGSPHRKPECIACCRSRERVKSHPNHHSLSPGHWQ